MYAKKGVDAQGIVFLVGLSLLLAFNQIVIKVTNQGFQPVLCSWHSVSGRVIDCLGMDVLARHSHRSGTPRSSSGPWPQFAVFLNSSSV